MKKIYIAKECNGDALGESKGYSWLIMCNLYL